MTQLILVAGAFVAGLLALLATVLARRISIPIKTLTTAMHRLANGDHDVRVPAVERKDEVGTMAAAVVVFKENAIRTQALEAQRREDEARKTTRQSHVEERIGAFERSVQGALSVLATASGRMKTTAESMSATAEQTRSQAVSGAAAEAAENVETVAAATPRQTSSPGKQRACAPRSASSWRASAPRDPARVRLQGLIQRLK